METILQLDEVKESSILFRTESRKALRKNFRSTVPAKRNPGFSAFDPIQASQNSERRLTEALAEATARQPVGLQLPEMRHSLHLMV